MANQVQILDEAVRFTLHSIFLDKSLDSSFSVQELGNKKIGLSFLAFALVTFLEKGKIKNPQTKDNRINKSDQ